MNKNEIEAELKQWKTMIESMDRSADKFHHLMGTNPESEFFTPIYKMMELYTAAVAKIVGDEIGWLQWFWLDCDMCRKKGYEAKLGTDKDVRLIKSIRDLAKLIYDGRAE